MADSKLQPAPSGGPTSMEEFARQQQVGMMHAAQLQFINCITSTPTPSKMPIEVRRHMWHQLTKTRQLFAPQSAEEEALYGASE